MTEGRTLWAILRGCPCRFPKNIETGKQGNGETGKWGMNDGRTGQYLFHHTIDCHPIQLRSSRILVETEECNPQPSAHEYPKERYYRDRTEGTDDEKRNDGKCIYGETKRTQLSEFTLIWRVLIVLFFRHRGQRAGRW
jgi:hypothetical protein